MRTLVALILSVIACQGGEGSRGDTIAKTAMPGSVAEPETSERVLLRAEELPAPQSAWRAWRLRFGDERSAGAFDFTLRIPAPSNPDSAIPMTRGNLRRVSGADGRAFRQALAKAFGADTVLGPVAKVDSLPLLVAVLGLRLQHAPGKSVYAGEFSADRPGDWIVTKLFLASGEAEVFLALNPKSGEAQLVAKDPDYANAVVAEFARLF